MKSLRQIILEIAQANSDGVTAAAPVDSNPPQDGDPDFIGPPSSLKNPPQDGDPDFIGPPSSLKNPPQADTNTMGNTMDTEEFKMNQPTSRAQDISYIEGPAAAANEASVGLLQRSRLVNTQKESAMQIHQRLVQTLRNNQNK